MLYQTPYPLLFQFHPFPSSSSSTTTPLHPSHLLLPPQQAETEREMECVETALKTSLRKDMMTTTVKLIPQTFADELSGLNAQNGTTCDDFFVDDLLDFSHVEEPQDSEQEEKEEEKNSLQKENQSLEISKPATNFSLKDDFGSLPTSELNVPTDDVADLEWLSHFVEDSFSEFSSALPAVTLTENPKCVVAQKPELKPNPEQSNPVFTQPCLKFKTPVQIQTKARSKRTRTSVRVWPFGSPCFTESSSSSTTTTTTTSSSSSSPTSPLLIYSNLPQNLDQFSSEVKPPVPAKKPKKGTSLNGVGSGAAVPAPRRCTHCGVQKTPQWRTGPLGAKTLCNACGVRYKSGRLLPEYRPACSPTFSSELHSNHHRKVLEMRRKKEVINGVEIETGLSPASVPSF